MTKESLDTLEQKRERRHGSMGSRNTSRTSKLEAKLDIEMRLDVKRATHKSSIRLKRKGV